MALSAEKVEVDQIVNRLLDNLSLSITSKSAKEGSSMRQQIGEVRANYVTYIRNETFMQELLDCFNAAYNANVPLPGLYNLHNQLFDEAPVYDIAKLIVQGAIGFCLSTESRLIALLEFKSRADIDVLMATMTEAFNTARELAADADDNLFYQNLTWLAGALTNHLANVSRPLPRMVKFKVPASMPALSLSRRIYYTAERWEEIVDENKIIHPAFCMREIVGLSS